MRESADDGPESSFSLLPVLLFLIFSYFAVVEFDFFEFNGVVSPGPGE